MSLQKLLNNGASLSKEMLHEIKEIDSCILENFQYQNEYTTTNSCKHLREEISIQHATAISNQKITLGYDFLEKELSNCKPEDIISMRFIGSTNWAGRAYYSESGGLLGVFLGRKPYKNYKTPPNWDGSVESLKKFNNK